MSGTVESPVVIHHGSPKDHDLGVEMETTDKKVDDGDPALDVSADSQYTSCKPLGEVVVKVTGLTKSTFFRDFSSFSVCKFELLCTSVGYTLPGREDVVHALKSIDLHNDSPFSPIRRSVSLCSIVNFFD